MHVGRKLEAKSRADDPPSPWGAMARQDRKWFRRSVLGTRVQLKELNAWVIRRLRAVIWKQWKLSRTKVRELIKRGIPEYWAVMVGTTRKGAWRLSRNTTVAKALPVSYFTLTLGLVLPG